MPFVPPVRLVPSARASARLARYRYSRQPMVRLGEDLTARAFRLPPKPKSSEARFVPKRERVIDQLRRPDYFGESQTVANVSTEQLLRLAQVGRLDAQAHRPSDPFFFSGEYGRYLAARYINRNRRTDGDFRYAYGVQGFKAWARTDRYLARIPVGKLADRLTLDTLQELSRLSYAGDRKPLLERLGHTWRELNGHDIKPGVLRGYQTRTTPIRLTEAEVQQVLDKGLKWAPHPELSEAHGAIVYPDSRRVPAELDALLSEVRAALRDPASDKVAVAADFTQRFIALHPFQDGNGRLARLLQDRILIEAGLPPPILADTGADLTLSPAAYREEVAQGVARAIAFIQKNQRLETSAYSYVGQVLNQFGRTSLPRRNGPAPQVEIDGMPYRQGDDGLIYDVAGRAYTADARGALQPMSQLAHYFAFRRAAQAQDPHQALARFTAATRERFQHLAQNPEHAAAARVLSDVPAIRADNRFEVSLPARGNEALIALFDPAATAQDALFGTRNRLTHYSPLSMTLSRYQQVDLEMWHVEMGLVRAGDRAGAKAMRQHREALFDLAQSHATALRRASEGTPDGFAFEHERQMWNHSPLRFSSFKAMVRRTGDRTMHIWRGDIAAAKRIGMWPDNVPFRENARQIAELRDARTGTVSLVRELEALAGKSGGTGYLSYTSNLELLTRKFGDATKAVTLDPSGLPGPLRAFVDKRLPVGERLSVDTARDLLGVAVGDKKRKASAVDVSGLSKADLAQLADELAALKLPPAKEQAVAEALRTGRASSGSNRLRELLTDKPRWLTIDGLDAPALAKVQQAVDRVRNHFTLVRAGESQLQLISHNRAFAVAVPKRDGVPGPSSLGGTWEAEQEISVFGSIYPFRVRKMWRASELKRAL